MYESNHEYKTDKPVTKSNTSQNNNFAAAQNNTNYVSNYDFYTPYKRRFVNNNNNTSNNQHQSSKNFGEVNKEYKDYLIINIAPKSNLDVVYGIKRYLTDEEIQNDLIELNNFMMEANKN